MASNEFCRRLDCCWSDAICCCQLLFEIGIGYPGGRPNVPADVGFCSNDFSTDPFSSIIEFVREVDCCCMIGCGGPMIAAWLSVDIVEGEVEGEVGENISIEFVATESIIESSLSFRLCKAIGFNGDIDDEPLDGITLASHGTEIVRFNCGGYCF